MKKYLAFLLLSVLANHSYAENCKVNDAKIAGEYTGECKDGLAHGTGRAQGKDLYVGQFIKGNKSGKGVLTWANGERYEGDFVDDKRTGKGVYTWANGERYEGDFVDDEFNGRGRFTYANGNFREGYWGNDQSLPTYGRFFTSKTNEMDEGLWSNYKLVKSCPRIECDPEYYPEGLDKKTIRDIVMSKITTALKDSRYNDAIFHFNYLEKNDNNLPESFYFYQINTLYNAGNKAVAASKAQAYLKKYNSNSKYYPAVIEIMGKF